MTSMADPNSPHAFNNRFEAGFRLANRLKDERAKHELWRSSNTVVVALPRGGVEVGAVIAQTLNCPLDILASKKIGAPENPEVAIGAVTSGGIVMVEQRWATYLGVDSAYIERETQRLLVETQEKESQFLLSAGITERPSLKDCVTVLVDDGIATGMTALAALRDLKQWQPRLVVLATPVIAQDTYYALRHECDELYTLVSSRSFSSVGQFFYDFQQLTDQQVVDLLRRSAQRINRPPGPFRTPKSA